jgi:hypothetical protein
MEGRAAGQAQIYSWDLLMQIGLAPAGGLDQHMPAAICWAASSFIWGRTGPPGVDFLLKKMVEHKPTPWLKFVYDVPHIDAGLVDHLRRYKDANPDLGVVGIDTLAHIRDEPKSRNEQFLSQVGGTHGVTGIADAVIGLSGSPKDEKRRLQVTGRYIAEPCVAERSGAIDVRRYRLLVRTHRQGRR